MHRDGHQNGQPHISESLCIGCGICINKCPHDALIIEQLPEELETDMIHRYSMNGFRLFRLPTPSKDQVVGILGPNGMGKSTAFNALSGRLVPNLGDWKGEADWDSVIATLPRGELQDFLVEVKKVEFRWPSSHRTSTACRNASRARSATCCARWTSAACSTNSPSPSVSIIC